MKRFVGVIGLFCLLVVDGFAQSAQYSKYLAKAKEYEGKKQWAFALDSYYDAIGCDDEPALKKEALNGYLTLSNSIKNGKPGLGKYNSFAIHDEWKKLLMDAEKLGSSICKFELRIEQLKQGDLDYKTKTASYKSKVQVGISDRYAKTIGVVKDGYSLAYKSDWTDLPKAYDWPFYSVSSAKNAVYDVGGAKILEVPSRQKNKPSQYYNAFSVYSGGRGYFSAGDELNGQFRTLYDYKFNIVDERGKELVKGKRWLLDYYNRYENGQFSKLPEEIIIEGITPSVMELIDNGKAFINPVAVYLEYGRYNLDIDSGNRTFIKNFPEVQIDINKSMIYCWNKTADLNASRFVDTFFEDVTVPLSESYVELDFNEKKISVCKTEVIQSLYEKIMGKNPSEYKRRDLPVENISWYDAVCFCNKLSQERGLESVYYVNGETDVSKWGVLDKEETFFPYDSETEIEGYHYAVRAANIVADEHANGYRLPTKEEWDYFAKGGEDYRYSGSDNREDVGWFSGYFGNPGWGPHPVAQKKSNGYGLFDMSGNVEEWCYDYYFSSGDAYGVARGDSWYGESRDYKRLNDDSSATGIRLVRTLYNPKKKETPVDKKADTSSKKKSSGKKDASDKDNGKKSEKVKKGLKTLWDLL